MFNILLFFNSIVFAVPQSLKKRHSQYVFPLIVTEVSPSCHRVRTGLQTEQVSSSSHVLSDSVPAPTARREKSAWRNRYHARKIMQSPRRKTLLPLGVIQNRYTPQLFFFLFFLQFYIFSKQFKETEKGVKDTCGTLTRRVVH